MIEQQPIVAGLPELDRVIQELNRKREELKLRPPGRPAYQEGERASEIIRVNLTPMEKRLIDIARGTSTQAQWCKWVLLTVAQAEVNRRLTVKD